MPKYSYGWKPSPPDHRDKFYSAPHHLVGATLPPSVDLRTKFPQSPIYQYNLGSCGPTTASADILYSEINQSNISPALMPSRLFIYWCTRYLQGTVNQDSGVNNRQLMKALNQYGWCDESIWPYDTSKFVMRPPESAFTAAAKNRITDYLRVNQDLDSMRACLAGGDPFIFGFTCYESIESPSVEATGDIPYPSMMENVVGGHDILVCFSGDTKIPLMNGKELSLKNLARKYKNKSFWVYSCDQKGNIVAGRAHSPRKTGKRKKIVKVILDNGKEIKCTSNHEFLLRNGKYKEARYLKPGDSLMPLYRKLSSKEEGDAMKGYEKFYNPSSKKWLYTHRMAVYSTHGRYEGVVHHRDCNKRNNCPDNLEVMTWEDHQQFHAEHPVLENLIAYARSEQGREQSRQIMKALWADPEWRKRALIRVGRNGKSHQEKLLREGRHWSQTVDKEKLKEMGRKLGAKYGRRLKTKEEIAKIVAAHKKKMESPEYREWRAEISRSNFRKADEKARKLGLSEKQLKARRLNIRKCLASYDHRLSSLKTAYTRWRHETFPSFEDYLKSKGLILEDGKLRTEESKTTNNHKVICVERCGREDVYCLSVDRYHNFALSAGVFVHNCGYSDPEQKFIVRNWWQGWGAGGMSWGTIPYQYALNPNLSGDFWTVRKTPGGNPNPPAPVPPAPPAQKFDGYIQSYDTNQKRVKTFGLTEVPEIK